MLEGVIGAVAKRRPITHTVNRLSTRLKRALLILVSKRTSVATVRGCPAHSVRPALRVLVRVLVVITASEIAPRANAIHRLSTSFFNALAVSLHVRASIATIRRVCADLVRPAMLVDVQIELVIAFTERIPSSCAVNGLLAIHSCAINSTVIESTLLAIQVSLGVHLVSPAMFVLVAILDILAAAIQSPLALAIHRLAAARLRALLESIFMRASIAVVQSNLRHLVHTAALVLVISRFVLAVHVSVPGANAVNRLGTLLRGALLKVVRVRASMAVVLSNGGHLVVTATLVLMRRVIVVALAILLKVSNAVDGLRTERGGTLNVSIRVRALVAAVFRLSADNIGAALLVDVLGSVVVTRVVLRECTKAVHRLGTALRRALLEGMRVRAAVTVVSHVGRDLVDPAAPVLVVVGVMVAAIILSPGTHAVHRLAALLNSALDLTIIMRTLRAAEVSQSGHLVGTAALVLVAISNMLAGTEGCPFADTVNRLAAASLSALTQSILMRASIAVVQGDLRNRVHTAALVDLVSLLKVALVIVAPGTDTIDRLGTLISSALLEHVGIRTSISVVGGRRCNLIHPAPLIPVGVHIIIASAVSIPISNTVNRLFACFHSTLLIGISIWASIAAVRSGPLNDIFAALLVLVRILDMTAASIVRKCTNAIKRLVATFRRALPVCLHVRAAKSIVSIWDTNLVDPAAPVLVIIDVMEA